MQSELVQQALLGMHALLAGHAVVPPVQMHAPPGALQTEPVNPAQSPVVQHAAFAMHAPFAPHAR